VASNQESVQRFEREAQAAGRIGNEHIMEVIDLGSLPNGDHFMVMEYLVAARLADPGGRRRMERRIEALRQHIIVAGLGRVGRQAAQELFEARTPFLVVDRSGGRAPCRGARLSPAGGRCDRRRGARARIAARVAWW
jgi:hypothetical protein